MRHQESPCSIKHLRQPFTRLAFFVFRASVNQVSTQKLGSVFLRLLSGSVPGGHMYSLATLIWRLTSLLYVVQALVETREYCWLGLIAPPISHARPSMERQRRELGARSIARAATQLFECPLIQAFRLLFSIAPFSWLVRPVIHTAVRVPLALVTAIRILGASYRAPRNKYDKKQRHAASAQCLNRHFL